MGRLARPMRRGVALSVLVLGLLVSAHVCAEGDRFVLDYDGAPGAPDCIDRQSLVQRVAERVGSERFDDRSTHILHVRIERTEAAPGTWSARVRIDDEPERVVTS